MGRTEIGGCPLSGIAGTGGFATTYAGTHRYAGQVAVKLLSTNWAQNADVARRFELECETLEQARPSLDDQLPPHVPGYVAHGDHDGSPYLITEFCAGGSLEFRLADLAIDARVPTLLWVVREALKGLVYIHDELGVVHRDLSPGNLLLRASSDGDDQLLIADFGMLKHTALQSNLSHVMGTAGYAAPEVRRMGVCDARSDVYSVGVIAWEILTGAQADVTTEFTRSSLPPGTPKDVVDLILTTVRTDREERPWVHDVQVQLDQVTSVEPAMPPRRADSFVSPLPAKSGSSRKPVLAAGCLLAVAGAVAGWFVINQGTDFTTYELPGRGVVLELTDDWDVGELSEGAPLEAVNESRGLVLTTGSVGVTDATAGIELVAGELDPDAEVVESGLLDSDDLDTDNRNTGTLRYREPDGTETQMFFASRLCGAASLLITSPTGFDDDDVSHITEIGERFAVVDQAVLPDREVPAPDGFITFSLNGVALAAPDSYYRVDAPNHCLFVIDDTPEHTRSISVNYYAGANLDELVDTVTSTFEEASLKLVDRTPTVDNFPRVHASGDGQAFVTYFVSDGAGVYTVQASEFVDLPFDEGDIADFDQMIATFRVVP